MLLLLVLLLRQRITASSIFSLHSRCVVCELQTFPVG